MNSLVYDIETAPLPLEEAERFAPDFRAPGNLKDPEKVAAAIAEKRADWADKLALSALTGRVLVIGLLDTGKTTPDVIEGNERDVLAAFWGRASACVANGGKLIGFNSDGFDLPFLRHRSYLHGVSVPASIYRQGRNSPACIDLMREWMGPARDAERISLDKLSRFLGVGSKSGSGKDFSALYSSDKDAALAYLAQDLRLTAACAERLGFFDLPL